MVISSEPRILHFHDCASVGEALVKAAKQSGHDWDYLSAEDVRPTRVPRNTLLKKFQTLRNVIRNWQHIRRADLVHVHYANVVPLVTMPPMPRRPYVLTLHGTDIRKHWANPGVRPRIQRWIDGARKVYYTNLDTRQNAEAASPGAEYMPAVIEMDRLLEWRPSSEPRIVFLSRWEPVKGADRQMPLITALRQALPNVTIEGLDWGEQAQEAATLGVKLVPKMSHEDYLRWVSTATLAIGQAQPMLGVSEFEAMAMGVPVAVLGSRIPRPDDNSTPPVIEGGVDEVVQQVTEALKNPTAVSEKLGGKEWAITHHSPQPYVEKLLNDYRAILDR